MQVFFKQSLAYIAVPKTGTTALEQALRPQAMLTLPNRHKHMTAGQYLRRVAPFLKAEFGLEPQLFAVLREPEDHLRSWYRYRQRPKLHGKPESAAGISFDQYVRDLLSEDCPPHARTGRQWNMIRSADHELAVHTLFAYEAPGPLKEFLAWRFGEGTTLARRNVSPAAEAELEPGTRAKLLMAFKEEADLHKRLLDGGGFLEGPSLGKAVLKSTFD